MLSCSRSVLVAALWSAFVAPAFASDGVLEINHTCATTTGCFAGDAVGYPVEITAEGSYRLTSDLVVPASTNGIQLSSNVSLDLNQFAIRGPVSCNPCSATGSGFGVVGIIGNQNNTVRNGKIRGFGLDGIALSVQTRVEGVTISDIARHAISLGGGSYVAETLIDRVGGHGLSFATGTLITPSIYRDNVIGNVGQVAALAGQSASGGRASGPNVCRDELCGTSGKKFLYLTTTTHTGAAADAACAPGFHMAALHEIFEVSQFEYDTARGQVDDDSAQGPPNLDNGWIRTGFSSQANSGGTPGNRNCAAWTTSAAGSFGTVVSLRSDWGFSVPENEISPWEAYQADCSGPHPVWCVQN